MFTDTLIESGSAGGRLRLRGLPVSIAVHLLVLGAAAVVSTRIVEDPADPPLPIPLVFSEGPPPPGDPSERQAPAPAERAERAKHAEQEETTERRLEQPTHVAAENELSSTEGADEITSSAAVVTGGGGGIPEGVPGGTGTDPSLGSGIGPDEPVRPGVNVHPPELVGRVEPGYPEAARKLRAEGVVILEAIISASGRVEDVRVIRPVNALLDSAAVAAVEKWRYRAATLNGRPVRCYLTVTVEFRLY